MTTGEIANGQVDDRVDHRVALPLVADQQQRAADAEDRVERHRDRDHQQGQLQRVQAVGRGDRVERRRRSRLRRSCRRSSPAGSAAAASGSRGRATRRPQRLARDWRSSSSSSPPTSSAADRHRRVRPSPLARSWRLPQRWISETTPSSSSEATQQHDRDGGGADLVAGLDLLADEDRGDRRVGQAAGEEQDRAELAERAGEGEGDAGGEAGKEVGEDDAAEDREAAGAERGGRLLHLAVHLDQQRLHRADDEGQGDEAAARRRPRPGSRRCRSPIGLSLP